MTKTTMFKKICGCGYETKSKKESWTKCPECEDNKNWEFIYIKEA